MFITARHLHEIMSPKKGCQRGLEEYISEQHFGDQQRPQEGKPSYMYLNNPVYRVGTEGDPAPRAVSSRQDPYYTNLKPNESMVHSLYPEIDSGSVFLSEEPWNLQWNSDMSN